jgi:hypothetical protein
MRSYFSSAGEVGEVSFEQRESRRVQLDPGDVASAEEQRGEHLVAAGRTDDENLR